jgi:[ribosomal protein S5]-alanine N-acetyltransferase
MVRLRRNRPLTGSAAEPPSWRETRRAQQRHRDARACQPRPVALRRLSVAAQGLPNYVVSRKFHDVRAFAGVFEPIVTARLVLAPVSRETAEAVLSGNLTGISAGEGWPHADTLDGLRMAVEHGDPAGWFVTLEGVVIGDCGTHGQPDEAGDVEIGYGLAAPYRGRGYGTELVVGVSRWLLRQPGVHRVVARRVLIENTPSRRALERAGFRLERADERDTWYALAGGRIPSDETSSRPSTTPGT